jgi:hypothetical protein
MTEISDGRTVINGKAYMVSADGGLMPEGLVKAADKLQDELVRKIVRDAIPLSEAVGQFRRSSLEQVDDFVALLEAEHQARPGGKKGNLTLYSYDGLLKIVVRVPDILDFGPELQVAKSIVDELLTEWSADSRDELKAIVNRAFAVDTKGQINRHALFGLLRHDIKDERWQRAMKALRDSITIIGSKRYIRIYHRPHCEAGWAAISIDLAAS